MNDRRENRMEIDNLRQRTAKLENPEDDGCWGCLSTLLWFLVITAVLLFLVPLIEIHAADLRAYYAGTWLEQFIGAPR